MDGQITPVHLIQPLYKHLMGWPVTLRDLEHIDDQVYRNLAELLDFDDVGELFLEFVVTEDKLGGHNYTLILKFYFVIKTILLQTTITVNIKEIVEIINTWRDYIK